jgi:hypothetical protein
MARQLADREPEVDWVGMLEQVASLSLQRWRTGEPPVDLRTLDRPEHPRWLLSPFIEFGGPTILFADGGTGKSTFAVAIAVSVASGRALVTDRSPTKTGSVLYCDWETDAYVPRERAHAIARAAEVDLKTSAPIYYQRSVAPLHEAASGIRRRIAELGIVLVVVDSLGPARGGDPNSAEATIKTLNAARSLEVPVLFVDHVTKDNNGRTQRKPFGSVYSNNLARLTWAVGKDQPPESSRLALTLTHEKGNNGVMLGRRGYYVDFQGDDDSLDLISFTPFSPKHAPEINNQISRCEQLEAILAANKGPMSVADMQTGLEADGVEIAANTVRAVLSRHKDRFLRVADGKWGLRV